MTLATKCPQQKMHLEKVSHNSNACHPLESNALHDNWQISSANKLSQVLLMMMIIRGVDKFFKTLVNLASSSEFSLTKSENNWPPM
jgi:hypothetical protein